MNQYSEHRRPRIGPRSSFAAAYRGLATLGARVGGVVRLGQVLPIEPRVDLRCCNVRVSEQLLHRAQIAAGLQQVRRKAVPQNVRMHVNAQAELARQQCQPRLHAARR